MKYCNKCGAQIDDNAAVCVHCGAMQNAVNQAVNDNGGFGWNLLGFCIPLVGIILYFVWKNDKPKCSKSAGVGALVSILLTVGFYLLMFIIGIIGGMSGY